MELTTIRQFAEEQGVSYEAIRRQLVRYTEELNGHVVRQNRTQFLDNYAVEFLRNKRRENPVVVVNPDLNEEIEELRAKLFASHSALLEEKDKIIHLQEELQTAIEAKAKYELLLEKHSDQEKQMEELRNQRDAAVAEAASYRKSIFGFYRKQKRDK